ncbi:MAG: glycerophosphodiester phosphodiesterase family protein [Ginsengibacter sp.]
MKNLIPFFMALSFLGCRINRTLTSSNKPLDENFDKQGHRGCMGLMPENTIPAFLKAIDFGVTTLEMDVVISKDKKVVVSHDPFFDYLITTKPGGSYLTKKEGKALPLFHMDYDEIKKYDVGIKPNPNFPQQEKIPAIKPLLTTIVDSVIYHMRTMRRPPVRYNIEIKSDRSGDETYHPEPSTFAELVMAAIKEADIERWTIIQSFDKRVLQYIHLHYPEIKTALLVDFFNRRSFEKNIHSLGYMPNTYSPNYKLVTSKMIHNCHAAGVLIIPWTVNSKKKIDQLIKMGVDGIITDYPNLFYDE